MAFNITSNPITNPAAGLASTAVSPQVAGAAAAGPYQIAAAVAAGAQDINVALRQARDAQAEVQVHATAQEFNSYAEDLRSEQRLTGQTESGQSPTQFVDQPGGGVSTVGYEEIRTKLDAKRNELLGKLPKSARIQRAASIALADIAVKHSRAALDSHVSLAIEQNQEAIVSGAFEMLTNGNVAGATTRIDDAESRGLLPPAKATAARDTIATAAFNKAIEVGDLTAAASSLALMSDPNDQAKAQQAVDLAQAGGALRTVYADAAKTQGDPTQAIMAGAAAAADFIKGQPVDMQAGLKAELERMTSLNKQAYEQSIQASAVAAESYYGALQNDVVRGVAGVAAIEQAYASGGLGEGVPAAKKRTALLKAQGIYAEKHSGDIAVQDSMGNLLPLDPNDPKSGQSVDRAIVANDPATGQPATAEQVVDNAVRIAAGTNVLAPKVAGQLRALSRSGDPGQLVAAARLYKRIRVEAPNASISLDATELGSLAMASMLDSYGVGPTQIHEQVRAATMVDDKTRALRAAKFPAEFQPIESLQTQIASDADAGGDWNPFTGQVDAATANDGLMNDYQLIARDLYIATGDAEVAAQGAYQTVRNMWQPTTINGDRELIPFSGNWNVDDAAARADVMTMIRAEPVYALGQQIGLADLDDPDNFRIEPNALTYASKGQAYTVTYLNAPVFDAQGRPMDWAPATQSMTPAPAPAPVARPEPEPTQPTAPPETKPTAEASMPTFGPQ